MRDLAKGAVLVEVTARDVLGWAVRDEEQVAGAFAAWRDEQGRLVTFEAGDPDPVTAVVADERLGLVTGVEDDYVLTAAGGGASSLLDRSGAVRADLGGDRLVGFDDGVAGLVDPAGRLRLVGHGGRR